MNSFEHAWGRILARSWADPNFRQEVKADPGKFLKEEGVDIPEGVKISVDGVANTASLAESVYVVPFPEKPENYDLASDPPPPPHGGGKGGGGGGGSCCSSSVLCCCCCP